MRFWDCTIPGCPNAGAVDIGGCERCESIYCAQHIRSKLHDCEVQSNTIQHNNTQSLFARISDRTNNKLGKEEHLDDEAWLAAQTAELVALSKKTNHAALLQRAKELSGGLECRLDGEDPLGRGMMGGMHLHLQLVFEDGTVWLARILRETYTSFDDGLSNQILLSECATLRWLEGKLDLPTPRLYGYGLRGDPANAVGVAYMLIDRLPGRPFNSGEASDEQKAKVLQQWAGVLCTLAKHPFNTIGSLELDADGAVRVGPIASNRTGSMPCIGPFENATDYYRTWIQTHLDLITDHQLFSQYSTDAYLMFKHLEEGIQTGTWFHRWKDMDSGPFFLAHMDDKGDHILVDEDFNITGIIDWTFARVVPTYEAFGPSLVSADVDHSFGGIPGLSDEDRLLGQELRHQKALYCFFESDKARRFLFGPGSGLALTRDEAVAVIRGLVQTLGGESISDYSAWREDRLRRWEGDPQLACLHQAAAPDNMPSPMPVLRFATCSTDGCERPGVRGRSCATCEKHICAIHLLPQHHSCPSIHSFDEETWEKGISDEVEALLSQINIPLLTHTASALRDDIPCKFEPGKHIGDESYRS
ncbi:hypothetical protein F5Y17DRAFT_463370 [Xylariaceae sp. FL0594]|nr:hypothetical protein F5Y17DRAFT_463370 [Xylariaceae sp. FL0594]